MFQLCLNYDLTTVKKSKITVGCSRKPTFDFEILDNRKNAHGHLVRSMPVFIIHDMIVRGEHDYNSSMDFRPIPILNATNTFG